MNRWVLLPSLHQALRSKFKYNEKDISLITLSKSIGKIDPNIDSLNMLHDSGFYRAKNGNIRCIFFQDPPQKNPPSFISTTSLLKGEDWNDLIEKDRVLLKEYMDKLEKITPFEAQKGSMMR